MSKNNSTMNLTAAQTAALTAVNGIGRSTIRKLAITLQKYEIDFSEFWAELPVKVTNLVFNNKQIDGIKTFKNEYTINSYKEYLLSQDIFLVNEFSRSYPPLLLETADRPVLLFVKGSLKALKTTTSIAVVGTRRATAYGKLAVSQIVSDLVSQNATIVSGFMYGIDSEAHRAALEGQGLTVGILGYGFNFLFPRSNQQLFDEILAGGGTIISEFAPHVGPMPGHFPVRNRIVAGMAQGVVVIEAARKSGSHITAQAALDESRLVFAVPGPFTSPYSEGTKWLINEGSQLVTSGREVIEALQNSGAEWTNTNGDSGGKVEKWPLFHSEIEKIIYDMLMAQPLDSEALHQQVQLSVVKLNTLLTDLELRGLLRKDGVLWTVAAS